MQKNFFRASRDKLWRYTNLWPIYKERRIRWPIYKERRRRRRRRTSRFSSQTTFSVWVSFSPAPEQKGFPTENLLFQTPSGNEKKTLFFFLFFFFNFFEIPQENTVSWEF